MPYILIGIILVVIDQLVKYLIRANLTLGGSVPLIPRVVRLTYVRNTGAAFSMLERHTWLLTLVSAVVVAVMIIVLFWLWKRGQRRPLGVFPAVMVIAGGVGNLIDRVLFGYVTDMFEPLFINFAVFNVADIYITVGAFWLLIYILTRREKTEEDHGTDLPTDRA